jgi:hypothetical protein
MHIKEAIALFHLEFEGIHPLLTETGAQTAFDQF